MSARTAVDLRGLRAVTRRVELGGDVLDGLGSDGVAWMHEGAAFTTAGVAARVAPEDAVALLATIEHDDDRELPGAGPIATGALGFEPSAPTELIVPARITGCTADGRAWVTELGPAES